MEPKDLFLIEEFNRVTEMCYKVNNKKMVNLIIDAKLMIRFFLREILKKDIKLFE